MPTPTPTASSSATSTFGYIHSDPWLDQNSADQNDENRATWIWLGRHGMNNRNGGITASITEAAPRMGDPCRWVGHGRPSGEPADPRGERHCRVVAATAPQLKQRRAGAGAVGVLVEVGREEQRDEKPDQLDVLLVQLYRPGGTRVSPDGVFIPRSSTAESSSPGFTGSAIDSSHLSQRTVALASSHRDATPCQFFSPPKRGSYNVCYFVQFLDQVKWITRRLENNYPHPSIDNIALRVAIASNALLAALRSRSASPGKRKAPEAAGNDAKLLEYDPLDSGIGDSSQADSGSAERSPSRGRSRKRERASDEEGLDRVFRRGGRLLERIEARGKLIVLRARAILGEELRHGEAAQRVAEAREMWAEMRDKKLYPHTGCGGFTPADNVEVLRRARDDMKPIRSQLFASRSQHRRNTFLARNLLSPSPLAPSAAAEDPDDMVSDEPGTSNSLPDGYESQGEFDPPSPEIPRQVQETPQQLYSLDYSLQIETNGGPRLKDENTQGPDAVERDCRAPPSHPSDPLLPPQFTEPLRRLKTSYPFRCLLQ
ncbi:hypothetical protein QBC47DRAFT_362081 [Echria macrotheca]|uniref:Uncharacterized protein n=1 Tax=Echria macrotheca TaxID=438768 RepID=A0AAJ0BA82_9PEZI|nr:hypothetical protein QBC47DRAFT_362081 [Echria macrotheca]